MPTNNAAWLVADQKQFEVRSAPYTPPRDGEIVIRNRAVAINPVDWMKLRTGKFLFSWIKYPFILGSDSAGEVVEVGNGVTRFRIGDRVVGHAVGQDKKRNSAAEGSFQHYTVLLAHMATRIPDSMSYETASVLPLGLSTAACGLFQRDQLALQSPAATPTPTGKTLLVWGGSTSVGCNAIQLAVAAGYDVVTTASPKNFAYVKNLGASRVFDYKSPTVVRDVIGALNGANIAGALAIGAGSARACFEVVEACHGNKFVSIATYPVDFNKVMKGGAQLPLAIFGFIRFNVWKTIKSVTRGVRSNFIFGTSLFDNGVGKMIYADFLPEALEAGRYVPAPPARVVGSGLDSLNKALDIQMAGTSAEKIVVSL
jgi:NADPH:quinone reductase-like Zn-dependent oxidoreductase